MVAICSKCFLSSVKAAEYLIICLHVKEIFKETLHMMLENCNLFSLMSNIGH